MGGDLSGRGYIRGGEKMGGGLSVHLIKSYSYTVPLAVKQWPLILSVD